MNDLSATFPIWVDDELRLLCQLADLRGREILDVGCGAARMTGRIAGLARRVVGIEVDEAQMAKNRARQWPAGLSFERCGAEAMPFADASFDGVTLFKSLHHIPAPVMDQAFSELQRVLRSGGWVFISEPVYAGPFNEIVRLFHDEGAVRQQTLQATQRAIESGGFRLARRQEFLTPVSFRDFDDFRQRMMQPTHIELTVAPALQASVRRAYEAHQSAGGAHFIRPMRADLLCKA
ncbi:MAG: class I SAM-dependent methyltransferase [Burkholderiaceae bacterium]|jgi:SAM-dependent methyltransferase|nr:class I SAM-dependent methyltransferase [Burkholderiaceae bacterium]